MTAALSLNLNDINKWIVEPAKRVAKDLSKRWNESAKVFSKWTSKHLPEKWHALSVRTFHAAPIALGSVLLSPTMMAIVLAGGYAAEKGFGPFSPQLTDAFLLGTGIGTGITAILRITAFTASYNPLHLVYGATYALSCRILLQQAKVIP